MVDPVGRGSNYGHNRIDSTPGTNSDKDDNFDKLHHLQKEFNDLMHNYSPERVVKLSKEIIAYLTPDKITEIENKCVANGWVNGRGDDARNLIINVLLPDCHTFIDYPTSIDQRVVISAKMELDQLWEEVSSTPK